MRHCTEVTPSRISAKAGTPGKLAFLKRSRLKSASTSVSLLSFVRIERYMALVRDLCRWRCKKKKVVEMIMTRVNDTIEKLFEATPVIASLALPLVPKEANSMSRALQTMMLLV